MFINLPAEWRQVLLLHRLSSSLQFKSMVRLLGGMFYLLILLIALCWSVCSLMTNLEEPHSFYLFPWADAHVFDPLILDSSFFLRQSSKSAFPCMTRSKKARLTPKTWSQWCDVWAPAPPSGKSNDIYKSTKSVLHTHLFHHQESHFVAFKHIYVLYLCSEKTGELDFSTFLTMMHRQIQQEDPKTEILEAFRMTDKQKKGYIQASELRAKLTTLGEKLTNKEGKTLRWSPADRLHGSCLKWLLSSAV